MQTNSNNIKTDILPNFLKSKQEKKAYPKEKGASSRNAAYKHKPFIYNMAQSMLKVLHGIKVER